MKRSVLTVAFACASVFAMAQENDNRDANNKIVRGPYETNKFFDNWFIGVGGGVNIYEGEYDSRASFGKRLAPALDISLGKWITPEYGVRLQYSGLQAKGMTGEKSIYAEGAAGSLYNEKFGVMNLHGDFMWNWSNAFCGYKETRVWNFSPFVGMGWARSYGNGAYKNEFAPSVGFHNSFRLGKVVDLTLEARQMFVNQRFEGTVGGSKWEGMSSVTVGLSFKLGKSSFKRVKPVDYTPYQNRIDALESNNSNLTNKNRHLANENEQLRNRKPEIVTVSGDSKIVASPVALFFNLGKATLDKKELVNLEFYVKNAIKADKNKIFTLIGSADSATGSKEVNQRLSEQRMQYVYDLLVNKYGISKDRLVKKAEGATNNRFSEPELNRVVIVE